MTIHKLLIKKIKNFIYYFSTSLDKECEDLIDVNYRKKQYTSIVVYHLIIIKNP